MMGGNLAPLHMGLWTSIWEVEKDCKENNIRRRDINSFAKGGNSASLPIKDKSGLNSPKAGVLRVPELLQSMNEDIRE